jgi:HemY protein
LIDGRHDEARQKFEAMAEDPETRELGLRGLYFEALRHNAHEAARHYAEKAVEKAPHLPWAVDATLEYRIQAGRFDDAIRLLESQRALVGMDRKVGDRKKAVMLTGRAMSKLEGDPKGAREDALHALRLAPDLVAASLVAARALFREDNPRKAYSTLEYAFKLSPHPEIAALYVRGGGSDSAAERLKRARKLENIQPDAPEALLAVAQAALDAREFVLAREKAEAAARADERESVYLLMADIEEADTGDQGRVRHWLSQALRAPRDPAWMADGQMSAHWLPVSPVTGRLDAFEWKKQTPIMAGAIESEQSGVDHAFARIPDIAAAPVAAMVKNTDHAKAEAIELSLVPGAKPDVPVAATPEPRKAEPASGEPFFGHPPDDPGVKPKPAEADGGFRLF